MEFTGMRHASKCLGPNYWLTGFVLVACSLVGPGRAVADPSEPRGTVLLVRGVLTVFSLGLDDLAAQLKERGWNTIVMPASGAYSATERLCQSRDQRDGPLVLVGHSLGGDLLPGLARRIGCYDQSVDLMVIIDSTYPSRIPANVKRCVNLYQSNLSPTWFRVFRGIPVEQECESTETSANSSAEAAGGSITSTSTRFPTFTIWCYESFRAAASSPLKGASRPRTLLPASRR
jgi:hypothetical protein